jgi:hypothetical protein
MWTQIVDKIRLSRAPLVTHWWHVPRYITPRGLTTSAIPNATGLFDIEVDLAIPFADDREHRSYDGEAGMFYPEPDGFADYRVGPAEAFYSKDNGQFLPPYEAVRTAASAERALLDFLNTTASDGRQAHPDYIEKRLTFSGPMIT